MSLARALAERLAPLMPDTVELSVYGASIFIGRRGTPFGTWLELGEIAALQDARGGLPPVGVRVTGSRLDVWVGDEGEPVLALAPIELP